MLPERTNDQNPSALKQLLSSVTTDAVKTLEKSDVLQFNSLCVSVIASRFLLRSENLLVDNDALFKSSILMASDLSDIDGKACGRQQS